MLYKNQLPPFAVPQDMEEVLLACPGYHFATTLHELAELAVPENSEDACKSGWHEVEYAVNGKSVPEARVCRVKNGIAANFFEPYMRRREPDCMFIGDREPTDKPRFADRFGRDFAGVKRETLDWLKTQELAVICFQAGGNTADIHSVAVVPANAAFFGLGLALLQGICDPSKLPGWKPRAAIYVAPPFRHTHFAGKQVVVHNRGKELYEIFSYNLYPGPSAKKGVYGLLLHFGEMEGWVTTHCSTVQVITPYDNKICIMHEGASGGGKSEMLEHVHRQDDGTLLIGRNLVSNEEISVTLPKGCQLRPATDDMGLCHPSIQKGNGKLGVVDAENAWFIRVNHITEYGTDPDIESVAVHPKHPLLFLNIDAQPGSTALLWEHIEDAPGKPCPNPRVIFERNTVKNVLQKPVYVDIRSFGVRTPPCTKEKPSYGILGLFHVLPPSLAWIWRLTAPRGHDNPSIIGGDALESEGVGSYWPFAPGLRVTQANLLLDQVIQNTRVQYVLVPNQHVGSWQVGFTPQWLMREYLARRGGAWFRPEEVEPARSPLLGYSLRKLVIEGETIERELLQPEFQKQVGEAAYDAGAKMLQEFFDSELRKYLVPGLSPLGRRIIEACLGHADIQTYLGLLPGAPIVTED
jgi:hypothetical protein